MNFRFGLQALLWCKVFAPAVAVFTFATVQPALAECTPDNPGPGGSVICSGTDNDGFSDADPNLSITVEAGATLTNANDGIAISGAGSMVVNRGVISVTGDANQGIITTGGTTTISNSGTISSNAQSIWALNGDNTVINSGIVMTHSLIAVGISVQDDNNTITNSGKIVATTDGAIAPRAIRFDGDSNQLNLLAPSFLAGTLVAGGTNLTVDVTTGPSHSVLWAFDPVTLVGGTINAGGTVPFFYDAATGQFATFDPTRFAASVDQLNEITGIISDLTDRPDGLSSANNDVWIKAFGRLAVFEGDAATLNRDITSLGIAAGGNARVSDRMLLGLTGGYVGSIATANSRFASAIDNKTHSLFANANGQFSLDAFFVGFGLSAGASAHNDRRFVNDNNATLGESWSSANYGSWWLSPQISIGTSFAATDGWVVTPSAQIRYAFENIQGFAETGSNANALVGAHAVGVGEAKLEVAAAKQFDFGTLTGRIGAKARRAFGAITADVTLLGQTKTVTYQAANQFSGYVGVDANFLLSETAELNISGEALLGNGAKSFGGSATLSNSF